MLEVVRIESKVPIFFWRAAPSYLFPEESDPARDDPTHLHPTDASAATIAATRNRILATTDGSELGNRALEHAQSLSRALGAELVILYVQRDPSGPIDEYSRDRITPADLRRHQERLTALLSERYPDARLRFEPRLGKSIQRIVVRVREQEEAKMIVMSTHGRSGLRRALLGSVAEEIMKKARVPVLLIKGDQPVVNW
ncbi:universal stress protein [Deinococcus sp. Marseille-Q6407]|uniref:universal stress protein n=1 Tax=Deinococcus sp. Marseille-Q6407 TaxID=2969223 RepID=UPI0021BF010B|nr:universal stress protein [Deinococcus sp. Marseille-Q6407]